GRCLGKLRGNMNEATVSLLRRNVAVRRLVASRLITAAGAWLADRGPAGDVFARAHSSRWGSAGLVADFVPSVAVVALAGARLDRISRRTLVVGAEVVSAIVFVLIPFAPGPAAIVALALVAGCAGAVYFPTIRALMPQLVDEDDLPH